MCPIALIPLGMPGDSDLTLGPKRPQRGWLTFRPELRMRICVLVDSTDDSGTRAGRRHFWDKVQAAFAKHEWECRSLHELCQRHRVFNFDGFDTVIVSTDTANGDFVFNSHYAWMFFSLHGRLRQEPWLRRSQGGRMIIEHQGIRLVPVQDVYDAILGPQEVAVSNYEPCFTGLAGLKASVIQRFGNHPILAQLNGQDIIDTADRADQPVFFGDPPPSWEGPSENPSLSENPSVFERKRGALYGGWFEHWGPGWVPLLQAADNAYSSKNHAILLAKIIDDTPRKPGDPRRRGLFVASTMRLAIGAPIPLLDGLLNADFVSVARYHRRLERGRQIATVCVALILMALFAAPAIAVLWIRAVLMPLVPDALLKETLGAVLAVPVFVLGYGFWSSLSRYACRPYLPEPAPARLASWLTWPGRRLWSALTHSQV